MSDPYLGEIRLVSFSFAPKGWALCNGQLLAIGQNTALFALLGTLYGGNGVTNFALPNLQGRTPLHVGPTTSHGQIGGAAAVALTLGQMPAHSHTLFGTNDFANASAPGLALPAARPRGGAPHYTAAGGSSVSMHSDAVARTGAAQAHDNLQPYLVMNHIIAMVGIFPPRN
jgi:microcystin-dependent protein